MTFDQVLEMLTTAVGDDMFSKENLRETFEKWDIDGDGAISSAELRIALQTSFGDGLASIAAILTDEEVEDVMIEADEDGSGDISFDEFRRIVPYLRELTKM
jgi:calmodulin